MLSRSDIEDPYSQAVEGKNIHTCLHVDNNIFRYVQKNCCSAQSASRFPFPRSNRFPENGDFAWEVCKKRQDGDVERTC